MEILFSQDVSFRSVQYFNISLVNTLRRRSLIIVCLYCISVQCTYKNRQWLIRINQACILCISSLNFLCRKKNFYFISNYYRGMIFEGCYIICYTNVQMVIIKSHLVTLLVRILRISYFNRKRFEFD